MSARVAVVGLLQRASRILNGQRTDGISLYIQDYRRQLSKLDSTAKNNAAHLSKLFKMVGLLHQQRRHTSKSTANHDRSPAVVHRDPCILQLPQLPLIRLVLLTLLLASGGRLLHLLSVRNLPLVQRHHDTQGVSGRCNAETGCDGKAGQFGRCETRLAGEVVCCTRHDEVAEGANGVEGREEVLAVMKKVGCHVAGVVGRDVWLLQHWHDQR